MGTIRYIEHTADAGVEITAQSREELFVLGARALYQLIVDYDETAPRTRRCFTLTAADFAELFHAWLAELLFLFDTEGFIFKRFGFGFDSNNTTVEVIAEGEELDPARHRPHGEVKNVTYHDFAVEEADGAFTARVIFDL